MSVAVDDGVVELGADLADAFHIFGGAGHGDLLGGRRRLFATPSYAGQGGARWQFRFETDRSDFDRLP